MQRVLIYSKDDEPLFELSPIEVYGLDRKEAINGEHSLTITTSEVLEKGQRILTLDNRNRWREHVVYGTDESHESGTNPIGKYYCVWSLMHDLMGTTVSRMVGTQNPVLAEVALEAALSGTSRWEVGTVTNSNLGGASMYDMGGWEAMQVMTKTWGGEVDVTIEVGLTGVVSRRVDYYDAQGEHEPKRRFDFGADLKSVRRKMPDGPIFCRISPRGKGEQTETGGYGRKITIESVNSGKDWLQNDSIAQLVRLPDGSGGWEYPTRIVENSQIETPAELKEWGLSVLDDYTVPKVSYEVDAVQAAIEGVDVQGVSLGDAVHVVDAKFHGVRVSARVTSIETDMLDELSVKLKLGHISDNIATAFTKLQGSVESVAASVQAIRSGTEMTDTYLQRLVARLNEEINSTGGYWYLIEGLGTRTYDRAVSDPAVGAEATKVIEMRGGALRIADSKDAQGNWEFDTVFVSGHVAAQLVTAAHLEAGYIGSPTSGNYWNLDTGELRMAETTTFGDRTVQQALDDIDATITGVDVEYAQGDSATQAPQTGWSTTAPQWQSGKYIWSRTATTTAGSSTPEYSTPVMISGRDGTNGLNGVGISSTTVQYGTSDSPNTQPASWSSTAPTSLDKGKWMWVKTVYNYTDGTSSSPSYTKSYMGKDGTDGTSVTIKGGYDTYQQLVAAHPTGSDGDAYLVGSDLYVWNGSAWEDVGQIQGPQGIQGPAGQNGTSVTVSKIEYGTSDSASTQPSSGSWSTTPPTSLAQGKWLWVKTTYSNGSVATTKSYVGTDGEDGKSVWVKSSSKTGDTTTIILIDSDGHETTMTIKDGEDGTNGTNGTNGLSGYVHTAWANSANGTQDFSTSVSTNKKYLGVYTDNTAADSTSPSKYSWSLIKGANGTDGQTAYVHTAWANSADGRTDFSTSVSAGKSYLGVYSDFEEADSSTPSMYKWSKIEGDPGEEGVGVSQIVEEYYLSTSSSTVTGDSWQTTPKAYISGRYYWTRSVVTYTDGNVVPTEPVLARGLNSANSTASSVQSDLAVLNTQQGIFNKLTNNGQLRGIYMQNGQLYVNADYLKSGTISADMISGGTLSGVTFVSETQNPVIQYKSRVTIESGDIRLYSKLNNDSAEYRLLGLIQSSLTGTAGLTIGSPSLFLSSSEGKIYEQPATSVYTAKGQHAADGWSGRLYFDYVSELTRSGTTVTGARTGQLWMEVVNGRIVNISTSTGTKIDW